MTLGEVLVLLVSSILVNLMSYVKGYESGKRDARKTARHGYRFRP